MPLQPVVLRGKLEPVVSNLVILTELLAFTEELIYADYLEGIGYQEAVNTFKISEYNNFYSIINQGFHIIRITLLYYLLGKVSEENYKLLYHSPPDFSTIPRGFLLPEFPKHTKVPQQQKAAAVLRKGTVPVEINRSIGDVMGVKIDQQATQSGTGYHACPRPEQR